MKLQGASAPHIHSGQDFSLILYHILLALLPATLFGILRFGFGALGIVCASVTICMGLEAIVNRLRAEPLTILDGSAALTGLLLALMLPPSLPLWMIPVAAFVAIVVVKHAFGGLGYNLFNPALTAKLFLVVCFPSLLNSQPNSTVFVQGNIAPGLVNHAQLFFGGLPGNIGETSALALLIGAVYLFKKSILDWKIPASFLGTVFLISIMAMQDPFFHWMTGGALLAAFFMMTDYVTSPVTKIGRFLFGILIGILVMSIRLFSNANDELVYSIVLMNGFVPVLDHLGIRLHLYLYELLFPSGKSQ